MSTNPQAWAALRAFPLVGIPVVIVTRRGPLENPHNAVNVESATIAIGHLVTQTFKWSRPGAEIDLELADPVGQFVVPIWPVARDEARWPPEGALSDQKALEEFAQGWGEPE
jgi:hypothetical protein